MKLYRIEHKESLEGMWTKRIDGLLVLNYLSDDRLLNMPMDDDDIFRSDGKVWKTATADLHLLHQWFTPKDIMEMIQYGFEVKELECDNVIIQPTQILFDDSNRITETIITNKFIL